ncbi:MAG: hypothetical protein E7114_10620 [Bacteroidales bacterium]|nr:hypothetical protein [Bacteroidales bacterium]
MKRYIYIILSVILCGITSFNAFSQDIAGGTYTGAQFLAKVSNNAVRLTDNVTVTTTISVANGMVLTIDLNGYVLAGNFANTSSEAVINVASGGKLTIKDSNPSLGHAGRLDDKGVLIWGTSGATMNIPGGIIYNHQKGADYNTKGITVSGVCVVERAKIMGCYSKDIGAAVTVSSSGSFTMKAGEIRYNYTASSTENTDGERAGVIYGEPSHSNAGSVIDISNTTISDNNTAGNGGAIFGYNVILKNCIVERNSTTGNGGAVYINRTGDSSYDGSLKITSCTISGNRAGVNGGAIYLTADSAVSIDGKTMISGNEAVRNGGGLYVTDLSMIGTEEAPVVIEKNKAVTGGGIYVNGRCEIKYCEIAFNFASTSGGGIFSSAPTSISYSKIRNNYAMTSEETGGPLNNKGRGAGFYFQGKGDVIDVGPEFEMSYTDVTGNACMYYGGGGQVCNGAIFTMNEGTNINNNTSVLHGAGGLHLTGSAHLILDAGEICDNTAHSVGGAIHSSYACKLDLNGGKISGNTVYGRGGGVHINTGGNLILNGTEITDNNAYKGYDYKYSTVSGSNGNYTWTPPAYDSSDYAPKTGYGGGVLIDSGTCTMEAGRLFDNYAEVGGGGIALVMINMPNDKKFEDIRIVEFTLNGGHISQNDTDGDGAGIYLMKNMSKEGYDKVSEANKTVIGEVMSDAELQTLFSGIPKITVNTGYITDNKAVGNGGGAFQEENTKFIINSDKAFLSGNEADGSGGAVYVSLGTAEINGGIIDANEAGQDGGALYVNGNVTMTSGSLNGNTAFNGGGICILNGVVNIAKGNVTENEAANFGGGLYVANKVAGTNITLAGDGIFNSNKAVAGGGMAVGGPIVLNFEGSIQNNVAVNGGGIYLLPKKYDEATGATLNFCDGFIRNNLAEGTKAGVTTGRLGTVESIKGFGGGIFLGDGTTFKTDIDENDSFGFYGNIAATGADDIFANGNGTTVILPDISNMVLSDFDVPTTELFWVEDYVTDDTQYSEGSKVITSAGYKPIRYRDALRAGSIYIGRLATEQYEAYKDKYLCISLGYELYYVVLQKKGLEAGDAAIFNISYKNKSGEKVPYREVIFVGKGKDVTVSSMVALPPNTWTFEEDGNWSWKYEPLAPVTKTITTVEDIEEPIVFENKLKKYFDGGEEDTGSTKVHDETSKENRMIQ